MNDASNQARQGARAAFLDATGFDASDWAWEFLRRNPDYIGEWRSAVPRHLPCITLKDGTQVLRLPRRFPRAEKWGLSAFADPGLDAPKVPVFWHAHALKRIVRLDARKPRSDADAARFSLAGFKVERRAVINVDGIPLVLIKGNGAYVAVEIHGLSVLTASFAPVFELHDLADLAAQTELLKRLQRFTEADVRTVPRQAGSGDERLHHALIALDESLNGKTYRQIAITIFGEKKVAEEWLGPSQFLKDRTRRLVAKGTELMKGGYRDLLY
ncbi:MULTISPECIES: DUF2285 domain-containing protein [Bradyrhizobium]|uniref:DUF2285 domain-containing protein n=1 Tax=Bradyrhizobium elkanii TaxID=29448 RepID=UPI0009B7BA3D|nr:DUF2285 domain-containing protein [Bradyrhizobium elkanii]